MDLSKRRDVINKTILRMIRRFFTQTYKSEIEGKYQVGKKKNAKHFVFAKCLEMGKEFEVTNNSKLGNVDVNVLNQPRALDKEVNPRLDLFLFKIRYKKDHNELNEGQIVELINR